VHLLGEWKDLAPVPVPGIDPATVAEAEVRTAAQEALEAMAPLLDRRAGPDWSPTVAATTGSADPLVDRLAEGIAAAIRSEEA
jgi:hypothetical protein